MTNALKCRIAQELSRARFRFFNAVHARALVSPGAEIGEGSFVSAGAILPPNCVLERHVIVHSEAVSEHDCVLGEGANMAPGVNLAGRVRVGRGAYLYTGSIVIPKLEIGAFAVVERVRWC